MQGIKSLLGKHFINLASLPALPGFERGISKRVLLLCCCCCFSPWMTNRPKFKFSYNILVADQCFVFCTHKNTHTCAHMRGRHQCVYSKCKAHILSFLRTNCPLQGPLVCQDKPKGLSTPGRITKIKRCWQECFRSRLRNDAQTKTSLG